MEKESARSATASAVLQSSQADRQVTHGAPGVTPCLACRGDSGLTMVLPGSLELEAARKGFGRGTMHEGKEKVVRSEPREQAS